MNEFADVNCWGKVRMTPPGWGVVPRRRMRHMLRGIWEDSEQEGHGTPANMCSRHLQSHLLTM